MRPPCGLVVWVALWSAGGCIFDDTVDPNARIACFSNDECPTGTACVASVARCVALGDIDGEECGDGIVADSGDEECDDCADNSDTRANACRATCTVARCGDNVLDGLEACDDGNADDGDDCTRLCARAVCGDGVVRATSATGETEECDDGDGDFTDACLPNCRIARCGDGFVQDAVEQCDDGNDNDADSCLTGVVGGCVPNVCGDGIVDATEEQCDDGNAVDEDACLTGAIGGCLRNVCGDGVVDLSAGGTEECDDGNTSFNDACLGGCVVATCGDGFVQTGVEGCDDNNTESYDGCSARCSLIIHEVDIGAPLASQPTLVPLEIAFLRAAVATTAGDVWIVDLQTEIAEPLFNVGPTHAPIIGNTGAALLPLDDGTVHVALFAEAPPDGGVLIPDAGPAYTALDLLVQAFVSYASPSPLSSPTSSAGIAFASNVGVTVGMDVEGRAFRMPPPTDGSPEILHDVVAGVPNACVACAPTLVAASTGRPAGVFVPSHDEVVFVSLEVTPAGAPMPDVDAGFVACASPPVIAVPNGGAPIGQVAVTTRGEAWATTTAGDLLRISVDGLGDCAASVVLREAVALGGAPVGPPVIGVEPVFNVPVAFVPLDDGSVARVVFPTNAPGNASVLRYPIADAPLAGSAALNVAGDVFVADVNGRVYGARLRDDGTATVFLDVAVGAPLAGSPRVGFGSVMVSTSDGRVLEIERGGNVELDRDVWPNAFADFGNRSVAGGEPLEPGADCRSSGSASVTGLVLTAALATLRRRRGCTNPRRARSLLS